MSRFYVISVLLGVLGVGFARVLRALSGLLAERAEVESYIQTYTRYMQSRGADNQAYGALIERSCRTQEVLGEVGIMAQYMAPFSRYAIPNYQIIMNAVPAMHREFGLAFGGSDHGQLVGETLVRYMGWSADRIAIKQRELRNPVVWFREGVATLLLLPVWLLQSLGLLSSSGSGRFASSALFRLLTGVVALLGLLSALVTIILGWRLALEVVRRFWAHVF